jgi:hypothetical protein
MLRKARIDAKDALHHIILERDIVTRPGRYPDTVEARGVLCYWAVREFGLTTLELSRRLGVSQPTISQSVKRGERIVKVNSLTSV